VAFWIYAHLSLTHYSIYRPIYMRVAFGILLCGIPTALIATWRGSKLWLIAVLGPLWGWMLLSYIRV
jgi:hypothetical protein